MGAMILSYRVEIMRNILVALVKISFMVDKRKELPSDGVNYHRNST